MLCFKEKFESGVLIYLMAFLGGDTAEMQRQVVSAAGTPGIEDILLFLQSNTEAYHGSLARARHFSWRAVDAAVRNDSKERAALWQVIAALRELYFRHVTPIHSLGPRCPLPVRAPV
jgi:hypothetical protein